MPRGGGGGGGRGGHPFLRMYHWWSFCTLHLLACQVRVTVASQAFVVVFV